MGKVVKAVVGIGLAIVGVFTWQPWLIAAGLGIAFSDLLVPEVPSVAGNTASNGRLGRSTDPEARRKIVFGKTLAGMDQRYWEETNNESYYHEVMAHATHEVNSYGNFYIDGDIVSFNGSGESQGQYFRSDISFDSGDTIQSKSALIITHYDGTASIGQNVGTGSFWKVNEATFTGCSYSVLLWRYDPEHMLPRGIPQKIKQEVEGALLYDPRKDSTRGGSGTHRADDQTTWAYEGLDTNGEKLGRNNALQVLWYLIGWRIEGQLVAGVGVDLEDIDFASFITAANNCVTQEWYSDGILDTGDGHKKNLRILSAAAGGVVLDTGGVYGYRVAIDDTANVIMALDENDMVSEIKGSPKRAMNTRYNEIVGTFVDPAIGYQKRPLPPATNAAYFTEDGFKRRKSLSMDMVQDYEQGQKLFRLFLNKGRLQGEYSVQITRKALELTNQDIITVSFAAWGWVDRLFRITSISIDPAGGVNLSFRDEDPAVYLGGTVEALPAPSSLPGGNPHAVADVTGTVTTPITVTGGTGAVDLPASDGVSVVFDQPSPQTIMTNYRLRLAADADWEMLSPTDGDTNTIDINNLLSGSDYVLQLRHVNANGVPGDWTSNVPFTTTSNAVVPLAHDATDKTLNRRVEWLTARGFNAIRDPLFLLGVNEWSKDNSTTTAFLNQPEDTAEPRDLLIEADTSAVIDLTYVTPMPVREAEKLEFSAQYSLATSVTAFVDWFDASGVQLIGGDASTQFDGGTYAIDGTHQGGFVVAPVGTFEGRLRLVLTLSAGTPGQALITRPQWLVARSDDTVITPFDDTTSADVSQILEVKTAQAGAAAISSIVQVGEADNIAIVATEVQARIDGDVAVAGTVTTLAARVTVSEADIIVNAAAVVTEAIARADGDTAVATTVTTLTARVTVNEGDIDDAEADIIINAAAVVTEATARANGDTAVAGTVTTLAARVTTNEGDITVAEGAIIVNAAAVVTEATARANGDTAVAGTVTTLAARVTVNESDIDDAEGDIIVNAAAVVTEATARANGDTAVAGTVTTLAARVTTTESDIDDAEGDIIVNAAAVVTEATARVNGDIAVAGTVTTLAARVTTAEGDITVAEASIIVNAAATVTLASATVHYSVVLAASGSNNAAFQMLAGDGGSRMNLVADALVFRNFDGTGSPVTAMGIIGGNVFIQNKIVLDSTTGLLQQTLGASGVMEWGNMVTGAGSGKDGMQIIDKDGDEKFYADSTGAFRLDGIGINAGSIVTASMIANASTAIFTSSTPSFGFWTGAGNGPINPGDDDIDVTRTQHLTALVTLPAALAVEAGIDGTYQVLILLDYDFAPEGNCFDWVHMEEQIWRLGQSETVPITTESNSTGKTKLNNRTWFSGATATRVLVPTLALSNNDLLSDQRTTLVTTSLPSNASSAYDATGYKMYVKIYPKRTTSIQGGFAFEDTKTGRDFFVKGLNIVAIVFKR